MSPLDERRLQDLFRRERRSLMQYALGAAPYAAGDDRKVRDDVLRIAEEELEVLDRFGEFLARSRITLPYLGSFPIAFTDLNFVHIRHLLPKLVEEEKRDLEALEADRAAVADAAAGSEIDRLIELHQRHLKKLETMGG
jgi:hypothetical protein